MCCLLEAPVNVTSKPIDNKRWERGLGSLIEKGIRNIRVSRSDAQ